MSERDATATPPACVTGRRGRRVRRALVGAIVVAAALGGCSDEDGAASSGEAPAGRTAIGEVGLSVPELVGIGPATGGRFAVIDGAAARDDGARGPTLWLGSAERGFERRDLPGPALVAVDVWVRGATAFVLGAACPDVDIDAMATADASSEACPDLGPLSIRAVPLDGGPVSTVVDEVPSDSERGARVTLGSTTGLASVFDADGAHTTYLLDLDSGAVDAVEGAVVEGPVTTCAVDDRFILIEAPGDEVVGPDAGAPGPRSLTTVARSGVTTEDVPPPPTALARASPLGCTPEGGVAFLAEGLRQGPLVLDAGAGGLPRWSSRPAAPEAGGAVTPPVVSVVPGGIIATSATSATAPRSLYVLDDGRWREAGSTARDLPRRTAGSGGRVLHVEEADSGWVLASACSRQGNAGGRLVGGR